MTSVKISVQAIWMVDTKGLITTSRGDELPSHKKLFARKDGPNIKVINPLLDEALLLASSATLPLIPASSSIPTALAVHRRLSRHFDSLRV